jgi:two-component system, OmpR family, phosphate regulon sensor histidine kinase PhoR
VTIRTSGGHKKLGGSVIQTKGGRGTSLTDDMELEKVRGLLELRSTFLQLTVHELRRPLGIARGYVSLLEDGAFGEVPESAEPAFAQLESCFREMEGLLQHLTAVSRLDDGSEVLEIGPCPLPPLFRMALEAVRPDAERKEVKIDVRMPTELPDVQADAERLQIALVNLLSNAIKYTPSGSTVRLEAHQGWPSEPIVIRVSDQGPGISAEDAERVFEKFYRTRQALDAGVPGLGLGLYIVRRIIELHGGQVTLKSAPGKGSTITLALPSCEARWEGRAGDPSPDPLHDGGFGGTPAAQFQGGC